MSTALDYSYNYQFPSLLEAQPAGKNLRLATFGGAQANPYFFDGAFKNAKNTADILLLLSALSRTRFYSPGLIREKMLAAADPVVTCDGSMLRFEVFSVCCGAYARFDLSGQAIDGRWMSKGTTNVDFNPPMRASLATISNAEKVGLKVGTDSVELVKGDKDVVERKVKLPVRWLRSFVEVQSYQVACEPVLEIEPRELSRLLVSVPEHSTLSKGTVSYLVPNGRNFRISQRAGVGAVAIGAIGRLRAIQPLLRLAQAVKIYGGPSEVCALEISLQEGKFHFVLSPDASRGFSGEGQALGDLADRVNENLITQVRSALSWQNTISTTDLAAKLAIKNEDVASALNVLGTRGLVGYDIAYGQYFHRELPFDLSLIEELHPRLKKAKRLVEEKAVKLLKNQSGTDSFVNARVEGDSQEHLVKIDANGFVCTCDWFLKHQGQRGPCSHVLAVELLLHQ